MNELSRVTQAPAPQQAGMEASAKWDALQHVPVAVCVKVPLPAMTLRQLCALSVGALVESEWRASEEVPLYAAQVTLSWCEFAVLNEKISARLTRMG